MQVVQLEINNFRGIRHAKLKFDGHTLLVGANNAGKSTVCEALELVLSTDRLKRFPPVEEYDFYNGVYINKSASPPEPVFIEIEAILINISDELATRCSPERLEFWNKKERRLLAQGELAQVDDPNVTECLRIKTIAYYDIVEDEFKAKSVFSHGPAKSDGQPQEISRSIRQLFGFIYLRTLRTGSRALSLERGSLLDIILQRRGIRTSLWENAIDRLRQMSPPIDDGAGLTPILDNIEKRLGQYVALPSEARCTQLYVSRLSREHLRQTISFFMRPEMDQQPVPYQEVGTGTLGTLVLALLSFIAESKKDTVVFAMEEPEIAVPPHTQRRIANYLLKSTDQCFVTSHSPYVIECFEPEQIRILRKEKGILSAKELSVGIKLKTKTYHRHSRRWFAEAMLGRGVIVGEGITERDVVIAAANKLETAKPDDYYSFDLSGVSVIAVDGEGSIAEFGEFFADLGIKAYALFDAKPQKQEIKDRINKSYVLGYQTKYVGIEKLLVEEAPTSCLWTLLEEIRDSGDKRGLVPSTKPEAAEIKRLAEIVLRAEKGSGLAGRLIELCDLTEIPSTILEFVKRVYDDFKRPEPVPPLTELDGPSSATGSIDGQLTLEGSPDLLL